MKKILVFMFAMLTCMAVSAQKLHYSRALNNKAKAGNTVAMFKLGQCYQHGFGVSENMEKALFWLKKAARKGHVEAMYWTGWIHCYEYSQKDYEKSVYWLKRASKRGSSDAMGALSCCYSNGYGVEQDWVKAKTLRAASDAMDSGDKKTAMEYFYEVCPDMKK